MQKPQLAPSFQFPFLSNILSGKSLLQLCWLLALCGPASSTNNRTPFPLSSHKCMTVLVTTQPMNKCFQWAGKGESKVREGLSCAEPILRQDEYANLLPGRESKAPPWAV